VPYGEQNITTALDFEEGFKEVVGYLTEGRSLVFEMDGFALTNPSPNANRTGEVTASRAISDHSSKNQRWVVHYSQGEESGIFTVSSALDGRYIGAGGRLLPSSQQNQAADLKISFLGNGNGYTVQYAGGDSLAIGSDGVMTNEAQKPLSGFKIWSVSYHD
jgi:phospholipase C